MKKLQFNDDIRTYYQCGTCLMIFADPSFFPSGEEELSRYASHNNQPDNPGYLSYLESTIEPVIKYLDKNMYGLDYGAGEYAVLQTILEKKGISCDSYDPVFGHMGKRKTYDFIFCIETAEHFHQPEREWDKITALLKPGAELFLFTERYSSLSGFSTWYYKRDITHVCFYHDNTLQYISERFGLSLLKKENARLAILRRSAGSYS